MKQKILIMTCHSDNNRGLAGLTASNKWKYSARQGYDLITLRMGWEDSLTGALKALKEALKTYDAVVCIGSDVVFTNMTVKFEDIIEEVDSLVIAREHLEFDFPFNNDVAIWKRGGGSQMLIDAIINAESEWKYLPWLWQEWLNVRWDMVGQFIRLVPARVMNSCHQEGIGKWQPGDFVFHAMSYGNEDKIKLCEYYLQCVAE